MGTILADVAVHRSVNKGVEITSCQPLPLERITSGHDVAICHG